MATFSQLFLIKSFSYLQVTGWPRALDNRGNREKGKKKIPAGKNQGILKKAENQGKIREFIF